MRGSELARWLGVSRNSVSNWRSGVTSVPGPVERCLDLLSQIEDFRVSVRNGV